VFPFYVPDFPGFNANIGFAVTDALPPIIETFPTFAPLSHAHGLDDDRTGVAVTGGLGPIGEISPNFAPFSYVRYLDDDGAYFTAIGALARRFNASLPSLLASEIATALADTNARAGAQ
jgi:hypothetical protein